ncbi:hypothetical protein [Parerythrobacter jejuensis]|uniref:Uncharacterized protein n=1 Tax=Parerythrobacter jejuensis TaxID=795812 RepID=A0A845AYF7_9SPHN|nr:hypothetical protein [Parerythrobacter jejuensis]MXP31031.1 hypothetical protein [Parerythrobacter jejuensis]MXP33791.1 hypothetical protein [Parerythrobacter jejuensis]
MNTGLGQRIAVQLRQDVRPEVAAYAQALAEEAGAMAALFYGSNLRTGSLEGVLDFYVLLPGKQQEKIWPKVSYHECDLGGAVLRAKVATLSFEQFAKACRGESRDTTIWARFVQPSALVWLAGEPLVDGVVNAIAQAARTAARLAVALGPDSGVAEDYWRALFQATYQAEFRVEKAGREDSILSANAEHFAGLLPLALEADGIRFTQEGSVLTPELGPGQRKEIRHWWARRRRFGKPLNLLRLAKATTTFEGAASYAAWKVERHTGVKIEVTPFRERHPLMAAPGALFEVLRARRKAG